MLSKGRCILTTIFRLPHLAKRRKFSPPVRYRAFPLFYRLLDDLILVTKQNDLVEIENFLLTKKIFYGISIIDLQALAEQNAYHLGQMMIKNQRVSEGDLDGRFQQERVWPHVRRIIVEGVFTDREGFRLAL